MRSVGIQRIWNVLWTIATFLFGILGTFLFPPINYVNREQIFTNFGKVVAAVIVGLILVAVNFWKLREDTKNWWLAAFTSFILLIIFLFTYQHFTQKWTCRCDPAEEKVYLIGSDIKSPPVESVKNYPDPNNCQIWLSENDCEPEEIWTKSSVDNNRLILGGIYILTLSIGIICLMSVIQAVYCSLRRPQAPNAP